MLRPYKDEARWIVSRKLLCSFSLGLVWAFDSATTGATAVVAAAGL